MCSVAASLLDALMGILPNQASDLACEPGSPKTAGLRRAGACAAGEKAPLARATLPERAATTAAILKSSICAADQQFLLTGLRGAPYMWMHRYDR